MRKLSALLVLTLFLISAFSASAQELPPNAEPFQKSFEIGVGNDTSAKFTVPKGKRLVITNATAQGMYRKEAVCPVASCKPEQWKFNDFYVSFYIIAILNGETAAEILAPTFSNDVSANPGVPPQNSPDVSKFVSAEKSTLIFADAETDITVGFQRNYGKPQGETKFFISGYYLRQPAGKGKK